MSDHKDAENEGLLYSLLEQQLGVLARIDTNSHLGLGSNKKKIEQRRLAALEMSMKMANTCRLLLGWLAAGRRSPMAADRTQMREQLVQALQEVLATNFDHPYAVSAQWNLAHIHEVLTAHEAPAAD